MVAARGLPRLCLALQLVPVSAIRAGTGLEQREQDVAAIDPVKQISSHEFESDFVLDLPRTLTRFAALPPSTTAPYLTVTLDWQPDGTQPNRRPGRQHFDQEAAALLEGREAHDPVTESLQADLEQITAYLDGDLPPSCRGVAIVACNAAGVFEAVPVGLPLPNAMTLGPTPALASLARLADDNETYAVLLADQREATLSLITQGQPERDVELQGTDFPRHQSQGGWSQRRYERRAEERMNAFARTIAEETQKAMDERGVQMLVLAGDEAITPPLNGAFHQTVQDRIVGTIPFDIRGSEQELIDATLPLVEQAEREREAAAVRAAKDGVGAGGAGAAGPEDVLTALQTGQVMTLVMTDDFTAPGWADFTFPVYGTGEVPAEHPAGGDVANIVPVALEEEMIRLAVQIGAEIEIVKTAVPVGTDELAEIPDADAAQPRSDTALELDEFGGVAAVLRYALDAGQSTADL